MALVPNENSPAKDSYHALLIEIKERIRAAQYAALRAVNLEPLSLYWDIGRLIHQRQHFLGYSFGPHRLRKNGRAYLGASPSKKSLSRLRQKVGDLLVRQNVAPWPELRDQLNRILRGWSNYFGYGTRLMAYRAVDHYVYDRVRSFLRHRHKVSSRGFTIFSDAVVFGKLGVLRLRDVHLGPFP